MSFPCAIPFNQPWVYMTKRRSSTHSNNSCLDRPWRNWEAADIVITEIPKERSMGILQFPYVVAEIYALLTLPAVSSTSKLSSSPSTSTRCRWVDSAQKKHTYSSGCVLVNIDDAFGCEFVPIGKWVCTQYLKRISFGSYGLVSCST